MEDRFACLDGVVDVITGYMGGEQDHPTYEQVCGGETGHAEAVEVHYDPDVVNYSDLVQLFFEVHDPTTADRQGPDRGSQYRSVVFCDEPQQVEQVEERMQKQIDSRTHGGKPIVTQVISPAPTFWRAEEYHQHYYQKHRDFSSR